SPDHMHILEDNEKLKQLKVVQVLVEREAVKNYLLLVIVNTVKEYRTEKLDLKRSLKELKCKKMPQYFFINQSNVKSNAIKLAFSGLQVDKQEYDQDIQKLWTQGFFGKGNLSRSEPTFEWRRNSNVSIQEHLHLTTEEAFFLNFGLGCLEIYDTNDDSPLTKLDNPFIIRYVAYHYFRSLGWVVKGGMKFGCDYVLYEKGPVFKHA
ncbi:199_t:CDS:2, partial [Scutellospora calospora]